MIFTIDDILKAVNSAGFTSLAELTQFLTIGRMSIQQKKAELLDAQANAELEAQRQKTNATLSANQAARNTLQDDMIKVLMS